MICLILIIHNYYACVHGKKNTVIEAGNYFRFRRECGENYTKTKQNVDMNNLKKKKNKSNISIDANVSEL